MRAELKLAPDVALVGMISVLRSWKGHATFMEAAAKLLADSGRRVHFVIAGDGPAREEWTQFIKDKPWAGNVTLLGHRADVPNVLASLAVLVLPSYAHEGIPQIILQAQAMARPVVATTIGGIPEVVEDGVTGPPRRAEGWRSARGKNPRGAGRPGARHPIGRCRARSYREELQPRCDGRAVAGVVSELPLKTYRTDMTYKSYRAIRDD